MRHKQSGNLGWIWDGLRSFGVFFFTFIGILITFYFTTKDTLNKHENNFVEIGKKFDGFNNTLQKNYEDWAKQNKADQEKAERVREQFLQTFTALSTSSVAMKVQVENVAKQLDAVTNKLDMIQDVQRQNRRLQQQ